MGVRAGNSGSYQFAKWPGCAVLFLESLNRNATNRPTPFPIVSVLRGSACFERSSDALVVMHRGEKNFGGRVVKTGDVDFIVIKNRRGKARTRTFRFVGQFARIA